MPTDVMLLDELDMPALERAFAVNFSPTIALEIARRRGGSKAWDESEHPREPGGQPEGGQFTEAAGGGPPVAEGDTLEEVLRNMGANELEYASPDNRPDLYEKHPTSGYMVRNDNPKPMIIAVDNKPRIQDTVPAKTAGGLRLGGNEKPVGEPRLLTHLFRAVSAEDWRGIRERGYMQSDGRMNLGPNEGTVAAFSNPSFYLPGALHSDEPGDHPGYILRIAYRDSDGWVYTGGTPDSYVKTQERIPVERIDMISPRIVQVVTPGKYGTGNNRRTIEIRREKALAGDLAWLFVDDTWNTLREVLLPVVRPLFTEAFLIGSHLATQQQPSKRGEKWDEADHPREPAGTEDGGQFTEADGAGGIIDRVVAKYGVTDNWREAGYILPDGRMVQMHRDVLGSARVEHGAVALHGLGAPEQGRPLRVADAIRGSTSTVEAFMERTGAVRFDGNVNMEGYAEQGSAGVELPRSGPSDAQMQVLDRVLAQKRTGPGTPKAVFDVKTASGGWRTGNVNTRAQLRRFIAGEEPGESLVAQYRSMDNADLLAIMRGEKAPPISLFDSGLDLPWLPFDFDAVLDAAQQVIAEFTNGWWTRFVQTTQDRMRAIIARGEAEGFTMPEVIEQMEPLFGPTRARTIAVTETTRLLGLGAQETYRNAGFTQWEWRTVRDARVDPDCVKLGGVDAQPPTPPARFPMTTPFVPAHPNCRCWPVPYGEPTMPSALAPFDVA